MNAVTQEKLSDANLNTSSDCIAFVTDNQTFGVVQMVSEQYFESPAIRDGSTKEVMEHIAHASPPRAVIVDLSDASEPLTDVLTLSSALGDSSCLIAIGTVNDINLYRDMIEAGVSDYLVKPVTEKSLAMAFEHMHTPEPEQNQAKPERTQRVVVVGARGGVGSSAVAVTLAWLLAEEQQRRTALVDLDLEFGTVALSLDLEPTHGLREALENPSRLDSLFISSAIAKVNDRLSVLATEETMTGDVEFNPSAIEILFDTLARNNDSIVIDLPRAAVGFRHRVLKAATHVVLVTDLTLASLRDAIRILSMIDESAPNTPVTVVANRAGRKDDAMSKGDFQKTLGRKVDYVVAEDRRALKQAADSGKPLPVSAKSSKVVGSVRDIAKKLSPGKGAPTNKKGKTSSLTGWMKRGTKE